jgi:CubicO group peptidase (beta-lactamase class C family)
MADQRVVGASVLVAHRGRVLLHKGYGFADLGLEAPSKDETVYHIVGPMLPFTGVAVMQLVEQGKIKLESDISRYIPEFPAAGPACHRSAVARSHIRDRGLSLSRGSDRSDKSSAKSARRGHGAVRGKDVGE